MKKTPIGLQMLTTSVKNMKYRLILESLIVGIFAGLVTVAYRFVLSKAEHISQFIYSAISGHIPLILVTFSVLIVLGIISGFLIKSEPMIKGSGIPQVEGTVMGHFNPNWYKVLIKKFSGGTLAILAGLSLGREGPSIQLGASAGHGVSKFLKRFKFEEKYLITSGASAGLAAAFNAPLAGVMFALEEVHKSFSPNIMLSAMTAAITGDLISKLFFGTEPVFASAGLSEITPLNIYPILCIMGIVLGILGALYNKTLLKTQDLYSWLPIPDITKPIIPFVLAGILGLTMPIILGGGHSIIEGLFADEFALKMIIIILVLKFIFSMVCFCSGTPGGIFFPLLVLGALVGAVFAKVGITYFNLPPTFYDKFILLGMVGMFTAIVRAPITGIVLIVEMSGSLNQLLSLTVVTIFAYIVAELLRSKPIYDSLLDRMVKPEYYQPSQPIIFRAKINFESHLDGAIVRELRLPADCLLVSVEREGEDILPTNSTQLKDGDTLVIVSKTTTEPAVREYLRKLKLVIN